MLSSGEVIDFTQVQVITHVQVRKDCGGATELVP